MVGVWIFSGTTLYNLGQNLLETFRGELVQKLRSVYYVPVKSKLQHPPPRVTPRAFEILKIGLFKIPSPRGKKAVQMPHQLVLKYLSSKTNFALNQTLFTLSRERCAVMSPSNFLLRPF